MDGYHGICPFDSEIDMGCCGEEFEWTKVNSFPSDCDIHEDIEFIFHMVLCSQEGWNSLPKKVNILQSSWPQSSIKDSDVGGEEGKINNMDVILIVKWDWI